MDSAIWATWYDLPPERVDEYLDWAHNDYLPKLQGRAGYVWAAHYKTIPRTPHFDKIRKVLARADVPGLGTGCQYALLVGTVNALTLFNPGALDLEAAETGKAREMIGLRQGTQTYIYNEFARVNGPEFNVGVPGGTAAPAIQMGTLRVKTQPDENDIGKWYAQYRLPYMARMPGCIATRVMSCLYGWPRYGVLYEFTSLQSRYEHFEVPHESLGMDEKEWTGKLARYVVHVPGSPIVGERIWPPLPRG